MANYRQGFDTTYIADVDISASQWYFVVAASTNRHVTISTTAGGSALGVLQNNPVAGEEAVVRYFGYSKVRANAEAAASPISNTGYVKSGSDGMATGYVNAAASVWALGRGEEDYASGSGAYIEIFVMPGILRG